MEVVTIPGILVAETTEELKGKEADLIAELKRRAVSQGIVDSVDQVVVRDILPYTDFSGTASGGGYLTNAWRADLRTYQQNASTAAAAGAYNEVISKDLGKEKIIGILGVQKFGEDLVSAVRFSLGTGVKIKDIWSIESVAANGRGLALDPLIYDATNKIVVDYYLKNTGIVNICLLGKVAEAVGDTIIGGQD